MLIFGRTFDEILEPDLNIRLRPLVAIVVGALICLGAPIAEAAADGPPSRPTLLLPDQPVYAPTGQHWLLGYSKLYVPVDTTANSETGEHVDSVELVVPGVTDQTVPAPDSGTGAVTFDLTAGFPFTADGYMVAIDHAGVTSDPVPVLVKLVRTSANLSFDSGATHQGEPELQGDDAHITVIPEWQDGPDQTTSWLTDIDVEFNLRPVGSVSGLQAFGPVTLQLHETSGQPLIPGEQQLSVCSTDNHGKRQCNSVAVYVVNPVTATWTVGTTEPGVPNTVTATIHNTTALAIHSLSLRLRDGTEVASAVDPATPVISASMTFDPGLNYPNVAVTLSNGRTYMVFDEVDSRVPVESVLTAPADPEWGQDTIFHARATSSRGNPQQGLVLQLQSRGPGASTWVSRGLAATNRSGRATLSVASSATGSATWRVISSRTVQQEASRSATHMVHVHAAFGALPTARTAKVGTTTRYSVAIQPAKSHAVVDVQYRRAGTVQWTTSGQARVTSSTTAVALRLTRIGRYQVRVRVEPTTQIIATVSASWTLRVQ